MEQTNQKMINFRLSEHIRSYYTRYGKIQLEESEGEKFNVIFIEQEDGAGCHNSYEYLKFKKKSL